MVKWLIFSSFIFCLSMTILGLIVDLTFQLHYVPQIEKWQAQLSHSSDSYQKEKTYFDNHPFFSRQNSDGKDFADYLRSRVSSEKDFVLIDFMLQKATLSLGHKWLEKRHLIKPSTLVEEVFNRIQNFSKWSVHKTLALNSKMEATEFIVASQIYIANSLYNNPESLVESLTKVRHMSFLLLGSEHLNFKLAGLSLLEKERDLLNFIKKRKMTLNGSWELVKTTEITRYRKFLYQTYRYLSFLSSPELLTQLFIKDSLPIGFCSIYREKQNFIQWVSPFLFSQFPFEPNYRDHFHALKKINKKAKYHCHSIKKEEPTFTIPTKAKIPYYRRIFALQLLLKNKNLGDGL